MTATATQVFQVYIKATPEAIWDAITTSEVTERYGYRAPVEIEPDERGFTKLTVTHELEGAPNTAALVSGSVPMAGGGWPFVLSDLKTLLETGSSLWSC